jgi:hypothetical protein
MLSRQQIIQSLTDLTNFRFVAYLDKVADGKHLVRLVILEFEDKRLNPSTYVQDFIVSECNGYLSAVSVKMNIHIDRLS